MKDFVSFPIPDQALFKHFLEIFAIQAMSAEEKMKL